MIQQDPFADIPMGAAPRQLPRVIQGPPREPTPRYSDEAAVGQGRAAAAPYDAPRAAAEARKAAAEAQAAEDTRARHGLTADQFNALNSQYNSLGLLERGIDDLDGLYRQNYQGRRSTIGGYAPNIINPTAQQFESAGNRLMSSIAAAQGLSAQQQNTPTELRIRFGPMIPQATDSDAVIEDKIHALRDLLGTQRTTLVRQLGLEGHQSGAETGTAAASGLMNVVRGGPQDPPPTDPTRLLPPGPSNPNQVQPGENFGPAVQLPPATDSERAAGAGQNVLGAGGNREATPEERAAEDRFAGQLTSLARRGATVDQLNQFLAQNHRNALTPDAIQMLDHYQNRRNRFPGFGPVYPEHPKTIEQILAEQATGGGSSDSPGTAAVANFEDSASLGIPGLFSSRYRERLADTRELHPVASTIGGLAGGLVSPGGPRPGMSLLEQTGRSAAQGFVYGLGESGGDPENALIGGTIGAAAPGAFRVVGRAARPVTNFLTRTPVSEDVSRVAQALRDEDIPGSRPIVDPSSRDRMMYLEASRGTGNIIREGLDATRQGVEGRAGELGRGGTAQEPGTMGDVVQNAGLREHGNERARLSRDYDRAGQMADGAPIYGREFVAEIDSQIADLSRNPNRNRAVIGYLNTIKRDFVDENGQLIPRTIDDFRNLRTDLSGEINRRNLTQTPAERLVSRALDSARGDIRRDLNDIHSLDPASEQALRRQGAWQLYRRTDLGWQQQARFRRQVLDRIIGPADNPKLGGQVMDQIRTLARSDNATENSRLSRLWGRLSPTEARDTAATIAESFGREGPDDPFSPARFLARTARIQPSAARVIFGEEGARSLTNLRTISQAYKETYARLNNSRSGAVRNWANAFRDLARGGPIGIGLGVLGGASPVVTGGAGLALGAASAGAGMGLRRLSARALMNPDVSRWIAVSSRASTPGAIRQQIERLVTVERSNPALAQEISGLRQALLNAVNDNAPQAGRAAASPNEGPDNADQ